MFLTSYELGWYAAESGLTIGQCPFIGGAAIAWRAGFREFHSH